MWRGVFSLFTDRLFFFSMTFYRSSYLPIWKWYSLSFAMFTWTRNACSRFYRAISDVCWTVFFHILFYRYFIIMYVYIYICIIYSVELIDYYYYIWYSNDSFFFFFFVCHFFLAFHPCRTHDLTCRGRKTVNILLRTRIRLIVSYARLDRSRRQIHPSCNVVQLLW